MAFEVYGDYKKTTEEKKEIFKKERQKLEKELIDNLIMSNSILSLFILWGKYDNIEDNIRYYNDYISKENKFNKFQQIN